MSSDALRFEGSASGYQNSLLIGNRKLENTAIVTPVKFNLSEPWTGTWEVDTAGGRAEGQWVLKQQGNRIKSAEASSFVDLSAKIKGNQLEGRINWGSDSSPIKLKISADGQSFEGTLAGWGNIIGWVKGKRKK